MIPAEFYPPTMPSRPVETSENDVEAQYNDERTGLPKGELESRPLRTGTDRELRRFQ